jgi:hypothetical protein
MPDDFILKGRVLPFSKLPQLNKHNVPSFLLPVL